MIYLRKEFRLEQSHEEIRIACVKPGTVRRECISTEQRRTLDGAYKHAPISGYKTLQDLYVSILWRKAVLTVLFFTLNLVGLILRVSAPHIVSSIFICSGILGLTWEVCTLPTNMMKDCVGNHIDMCAGLLYTKDGDTIPMLGGVAYVPRKTNVEKQTGSQGSS